VTETKKNNKVCIYTQQLWTNSTYSTKIPHSSTNPFIRQIKFNDQLYSLLAIDFNVD